MTPSSRIATLSTGLERWTRRLDASARASAWLPPAMPRDGASLIAATPASSPASTSLGRSGRRDLHARADRLADAGRQVEAVEQRCGGAVPRRLELQRLLDRCRGGPQLLLGHRLTAARLAPPVRHPLVPQAEAEPACRLLDDRVAGQDELGAHLDDAAVRQLARPHAPADAVARLEHDHLTAGLHEGLGGRQAGETRSDDGDVDQAPIVENDEAAPRKPGRRRARESPTGLSGPRRAGRSASSGRRARP